MNVLMVHPHDIYSPLEPWTIRIKSFAKRFVERGYNIKLVYFPLNPKDKIKPHQLEGFEVIPLSRKLGSQIILENIITLCGLVDWADIVHFQKCFHYASVPVLIASYIKNKPIHYDWDDWELKIFHCSRQPVLVSMCLNYLERFIPKLVDTVSVSSERLRQLAIECGVKEDRVFKVHVGADLQKFNPRISCQKIKNRYKLNGPVILYLGQLQGGQYVELFINTAQIVLNEFPQVHFLIVGGGYRLEGLKQLAKSKKMELEKNIIFTNYVSYDDVPQYVVYADIAVACFEDNDITQCKSPLKIAEYLASGKAIIASNVGEVRRMLGGVGLLVEPGNSKALAEGIIKLLKDTRLRKKMGRLARERAKHKYNWETSVNNLQRAYKTAISLNEK